METGREIDIRLDNQRFARDIQAHVKKRGWYNTAKVLREVVSVHVGWDSEFTELDNVLRRIERTFSGEVKEVTEITDLERAAGDYTESKLDIPDLPDGKPSDHFS